MTADMGGELVVIGYPFWATGSRCRITVLSEQYPDKTSSEELLADVWSQFQESIARNRWEPVGEWVVALLPEDTDYHDVIAAHIAERVDEAHREHPELVPVSLVLLDSAQMHDASTLN